jgi:ATP-dependent Lhr-like helicase
MLPERADHAILMALKNRLMEESVTLYCLGCGSKSRRQIKNVQERLKCSACGGLLMAALSPPELTLLDARSGKVKKQSVEF